MSAESSTLHALPVATDELEALSKALAGIRLPADDADAVERIAERLDTMMRRLAAERLGVEYVEQPGSVEMKTVDPVAAAERAVSWLPTSAAAPDPFHLAEAIRELAHGLAAVERRRRAQ